MPPKRPRGIQRSNISTSNTNDAQKNEENDPQDLCTIGNSPSTNEVSILMDESESLPADDLEACSAMYIQAKSLFSQNENFEMALTLLRGTIHECYRISSLSEYQTNPKRFEILGGALFLLGIYKTEQDDGTSKEFFEISKENFALLKTCDTSDTTMKTQQALDVAILIESGESDEAFLKISDICESECIHLIHFLEHRRCRVDASIKDFDLEEQLWRTAETKTSFREFGIGNVLFQKASSIFNQMTLDMDNDTICEDSSTFDSCFALCNEAIEHLNEACVLEDHPSEKHYLPLAECFLLQANIGDILEYEPNQVIDLYTQAIKRFETALMYDSSSVDEEVMRELREILNELQSEL